MCLYPSSSICQFLLAGKNLLYANILHCNWEEFGGGGGGNLSVWGRSFPPPNRLNPVDTYDLLEQEKKTLTAAIFNSSCFDFKSRDMASMHSSILLFLCPSATSSNEALSRSFVATARPTYKQSKLKGA